MASGFDQAAATRICNAMCGLGYTAPTKPVNVRLMTTMGTPTVNGTEVVNAAGSTYVAQVFVPVTGTVPTPASAVAGSLANSGGAITFANMPDTSGVTGVKAVEFWDSAATPLRQMLGTLAVAKTTALGDSITFATSQLAMNVAIVLA